MTLQTINQVSRRFDISTRTLRYYEQIGLLQSIRTADYAYRTYDADALRRLQQIIILKKLRIPLKTIKEILVNEDALVAIRAFEAKIDELMCEISALSTIQTVLDGLVTRLKEHYTVPLSTNLLQSDELLSIVASLSSLNISIKEELSMSELTKAQDSLSKLTDVRIVYLPPSAVAASHYIGDEPEYHAGVALNRFVLESGLCEKKPDLRLYGFNHPNPVDETNFHGYEMWVTIPDDMDPPAPLVKKQFAGGLYAAHMIAMGNFHEWEWLAEWVNNNEKYEFNGMHDNGECMFGSLEEHLNYVNHVKLGVENSEPEGMQLDLLIPVKEKQV